MEQYKQEFIEFMVESDVLKFGDFTLKSGRKSPFFMNAGAYVTGSQLSRLGEYYAKAIHASYGDDFDVLLDQLTRVFHLQLLLLRLIQDCMVRKSSIAVTVRKRRITVLIRVAFLVTSQLMVTVL